MTRKEVCGCLTTWEATRGQRMRSLGRLCDFPTRPLLDAVRSTAAFQACEKGITLSSNLNGSVDFLLQASASNSTIGNWSTLGSYSNCANGVSVSSYAINTSNSFIANWTSPSTLSVNSVSIRAFLNNSMGVFMIEKNLTVAATTTSATTAKTTPKSGGPANDPSFLVLTLCLLVITSKFLS
ncbi:unnamed protein product [Ranitomeya imitator]|uniref:Reelin domain-containing protein n=1 Tax=Ranitomeya imitator TaxID=111125 RepID=A0ABN9MHS4_9NEOB|nr:unnamed protein product [Ranitomeya imitator]